MRVSAPDVSQSTTATSSSSFGFIGWYAFPFFGNSGETLLPTGLCLIWFRVTIFSWGHTHSCSVTSSSSMWRWLQLIIPLIRRRWVICFLREQLNHLLVVLVSIPVCFLFRSVLVASGPYLKWFNHYLHIPSFTMPTTWHVWQLIQHGNYDFSIDLQESYLHIPIVKHLHHFYNLFGTICHISGRFYLLGKLQPLRISTALTKPILFFCHHKGFCIVVYFDDILVLVCSKWAGKRAHSFLCSLLVCLGLYINFFSYTFCFLELCWDTVHMSVYLPPDKLADSQQLALSLLQTQPVTDCWVIYFLGKANFCANGHSHLQRLCCVIQSDMLTVYLSPTHLFSPVHFSFSALHQLKWLSHLQQSPVPLQFPLPDVVIATDAMPTHWAFYFQGSGLPLSVSISWSGSVCRAHIDLQEFQVISMMLHSIAFHVSGKVVALHLDKSTAKAYLCNQGGTVPPFLSRLACWILCLTDKHRTALIPTYIPTHLNVEASYLSQGQLLLEWHLLPHMPHAAFHLWGLPEVDLLASSHTTQCQHYYTLETPLPLGALGLNAFYHPWMFSGKLLVSSSCISSSSSVQAPGRTCQRSPQTFDSGGTILDTGSLASHSSQNIDRHSLALAQHKWSCHACFSRPCAQGSAISAFIHLAVQRCVLCIQGFFLGLSGSGGDNSSIYIQRSTSNVGRNGQIVVLKKVYN